MLSVLFWKKAWTWLKHYWYWPVILILLIFSLVSGTDSKKKLVDLLNKQRENYEKELEIIKETDEKANKKKTEVFTSHAKELEKIEKEHNIKIEEIEEEKQKELIALVKNNKDRPDKLAEDIARVLSAEFLKKSR